MVEPIEDNDDTPPPTERPLLRKSLAFAKDAPTQVAISTYEPTVAPQQKKGFLPGQEVILPPKPKSTSRRNKSGIKRPRRPDAYPGQTSRFRLETYDPTPSAEPPIAHGTGPYSSMYRGVATSTPGQEGQVSTAAGPLSSAMPPSQSSSPNGIRLTLPNSFDHATVHVPTTAGVLPPTAKNKAISNPDLGTAPQAPQLLPPALRPQPSQKAQILTNFDRPGQSASSTLIAQRATTPQQPPPKARSLTPADPSLGHATYVTDTSLTMRDQTSPGPHYRRDYDVREMTPPRERRRSSTTAKSSTSESPAHKKTNRGPLRIVTLLIEDMRGQEPDSQLAELKVPLKRSDDEDNGWWADAKDIAEQLQSGPSRIDGPARAFTMRGKYRQFILRVTADNKDEFVSANVAISAQKTLDVMVELLHPPGTVTRPPRVPRDSWSNHDDDSRPNDRMETENIRPLPSSRKRTSSPSFDDYDNYPVRRSHSQSGPSKAARRDHWDRSPRREDTPPYSRDRHSMALGSNRDAWRRQSIPAQRDRESSRQPPPPSYSPYHRPMLSPLPALQTSLPSPSRQHSRSINSPTAYSRHEDDEDDDSLPADEPFIRAVDRLLHEDPRMCDDYFRASAGARAVDIAKQYELVTKMFKMWAGRRPPGFHQIIEEIHIARALEIEDPQSYLSKCHETMKLLDLYGKKGRVFENPRVVAMLDETTPPEHGVDAGRKLLRLLRAVDDGWKANRIGSLLDGINPPPPDPFDKPGPYSPENNSSVSKPGPSAISPPLTLPTPTSSRQHSFREAHSHSHSLSTGTLPAPPHSGSSDSATSVDAARYTSRGKGMFVD
ncbi:hypothetical protein CPB83DRAFT_812263 [Crepidotus variabilis]|uniref:Uncharacterized protein n=1 Tax=Crepidotus variabilis TaxID=179855 RepID=A0A9P6JRC0_9AGAR|nr:hypothetical protein CPB83DRAFT_812263 [Crepidotus variabilis]